MDIFLSILFFLAFITLATLIMWAGGLPFALMINKQFFKIDKKKVMIYLFGFNVVYFILFLFVRVFGYELVRILSYYMGIIAIAVTVGVIYWLVALTLFVVKKSNWLDFKFVKFGFFGLFLFLVGFSIYNFEKPISIEEFSIESSKLDRDYNFIYIGDIQYGTVSKEYMDEVLDVAYNENPEFILFGGDLIDFDYYEKEDFDKFNELKVPLYFIRGNHEFYHLREKITSIVQSFENVKYLENSAEMFDGIEIVGIDYVENLEDYEYNFDLVDSNSEVFSILLFHSPQFVEYSIGKGMDLLLYGHTHGGQIFPATLIVDFIYEFPNGFYEVGESFVYTTDGAGLWGPKMRLGTQNEIVKFNLVKSE